MMIREDVETVMKRFEIQFLNGTRGCIFREDVPELIVAGQKIGPFKAGITVTLQNWIIEKLIAHDLADIVPNDAFESLRRLQNLHHAEENHPHKLQTFPEFLYSALNRKMVRLQGDKTGLDPRRYDEIERVQRMIPVLVETRLSKIIRVAKSGAQQDKRKQMANEERWLCDELSNLLSAWRETVRE